jgi:hypothetical protein
VAPTPPWPPLCGTGSRHAIGSSSGWTTGTFGGSIRSGDPIPDERLQGDPAAEPTVQEAAADEGRPVNGSTSTWHPLLALEARIVIVLNGMRND